MKKTVINACRLMTALMVAGAGGYVHATDTVEVTFKLNATYSNVTCNSTLKADGDITNGTDIDFGTFSSDQVDKTKKVVLKLDCSQGTGLPDTVKVAFSAQAPADVGAGTAGGNNRLYPDNVNKNLYFDWFWGDNINETLQQTAASSGHTSVTKGDSVDLNNKQIVYEVNKSNPARGQNILLFPLKITRGVTDTGTLAAGEYTAAVKVSVSYD